MLSRIIAIPTFLALIFIAYLVYQDSSYNVYLIAPVLILASVYVLHPQLDWMWYQRFPPQLENSGKAFLKRFSTFYQNLKASDQKVFEQRIGMIRMAKDFKSQVEDQNVPEEAKLIFAACQAQLTFAWEDYLLKKFEKVIFYPNPFPSPKYPEHFHVSEVFEEETVNGYIFSLQHVLLGYMEPEQYYNVAMHELAQSIVMHNPEQPWPEVGEEIWPELQAISSFPMDALKETINRPDFEPLAAAITHYMVFPEAFLHRLPKLYAALSACLR